MPAEPEPSRFRMVEQIDDEAGRSVYVAHDVREQTRVQVVALRHALRPAEAERFGHEARILEGLRHAYLAGVVEHGVEADGSPFFVREDEGGSSLTRRVARAPLAIDEAWQVGLQITEALICLHEHGLVHGAVDADNIRWNDAGVAKLVTAPHTEEIGEDRRMAARADLAGLGRTLLRLIGGEEGGEPTPEPLRRVLRAATDPSTHPDLRADELRAAWLEAGAQVWPHRHAPSQPLLRPEPEIWPPAPDLLPAPASQAATVDGGDTACSASTPPRLFARRLELRTLLGTGKCGQTWRAYHHILGRDVAVKVLPRSLARTPVLADLCREAMALDKLSHRAFPRIYECDYNEDGSWYLVEEFIDGEPLTRTVQRGPMEPLAAVELAIELAEALHDAHSRGILHGDLSFTNLMLERSLPPRPRIIDLSECRFLDAFYAATDQRYATTPRHRGDEGRAFGHPSFAAPELFRGGSKSERSDVYSLGTVLFMLLTGAKMPNGVIRELLASEPQAAGERLREHLVRAAPELEDTFLAADFQDILAQEPEQRVASMAALLELLKNERDALRELRSGDRTGPAGPRARAVAGAPTTSAAWRAMSSGTGQAAVRKRGRIGWIAGLAAVPLVIAALWFGLSSRTGRPPPANPQPPAPTTRVTPAATTPVAPAPAPAPPKREDVIAAVTGLAPQLRQCPQAPSKLQLLLQVGGPTRLIEIGNARVLETAPFDRCARPLVEALRFDGATVSYAMSIALAGS